MITLVLNAEETQALVVLLGDQNDAQLEAVYGKLVEAEAAEGAAK